jgi:hypothetical protein
MRRIAPTALCAIRSALAAAWEFRLTTRMVLSIGIVAFASLGAATLYAHRNAPPTCTSDWTLGRVSRILRDNFHIDSIIMSHIRTGCDRLLVRDGMLDGRTPMMAVCYQSTTARADAVTGF